MIINAKIPIIKNDSARTISEISRVILFLKDVFIYSEVIHILKSTN
tara:strand:- start:760 stop:897 length:138 start_codon:yes stop_codon:yes gene_type:complete